MSGYWEQLGPYLKKYGRGCMAYSTLQEGMAYYTEEGVGFIAYYSFRHWLLAPRGRAIVLGDPVCAGDNAKGMLERFIARHPRTILMQCTKPVGQAMHDLGYEVNMWGHECELPVPLPLKGKPRAKLRQWRNKCEREGVTVAELTISACDRAEAEALSQAWIQDKGGKELALSTRPFVWEDEPDVRYFWARQNDRLIGLAVFDPMYKNGQLVGYYHNFDRISKDAPNGTSVYIILEAMKVFQAEGIKVVSLGLMPLYVLRKHFKQQNDFTMKGMKYAYRKLNHFYPFKGNVNHKKRFHGRHFPVYISSTCGNQLREVFILMKAMRMI